jgi:hypothetical protein
MKLIGPEHFKLTFDAKKCSAQFSGLANTTIPKLYVVVAGGEVIYVGKAQSPMRQRFYGGWNATGKHGYHGYAWRHTHTEADVFVWYQEDESADSLVDLETVEAEVVFLVRSAGQWPRGQTEIHFHPSEKEHRELANRILKSLGMQTFAAGLANHI